MEQDLACGMRQVSDEYDALGQLTLLLDFVRQARLFYGTDGTASWRASDADGMLISPKDADMRETRISDFLFVQGENARGGGAYVAASFHAYLYRLLPFIHGFFHIHPDVGIVFADATTTDASLRAPRQEAEEICGLVGKAEHGEAPFCVETRDGGYLVGMERGGAERMAREWQRAMESYGAHLREIGQQDAGASLTLQPILVSASVAGVIATHRGEGWVSCFLLPERRGGGNGRRLLDALERRGLSVKAHDLCRVAEFYLSHGWCLMAREGETSLLSPPMRRVIR